MAILLLVLYFLSGIWCAIVYFKYDLDKAAHDDYFVGPGVCSIFFGPLVLIVFRLFQKNTFEPFAALIKEKTKKTLKDLGQDELRLKTKIFIISC